MEKIIMTLTEQQKQENKNLIEGLVEEISTRVLNKISPAEQMENFFQQLFLLNIEGEEYSQPTIHPAMQAGTAIQKIKDKPDLIKQLRKIKLTLNQQNAFHLTQYQRDIEKITLFLGVNKEEDLQLLFERLENDNKIKELKEANSGFMVMLNNSELVGLLSQNKEYKILAIDRNKKSITVENTEIKNTDDTPQIITDAINQTISFYPYKAKNENEAWLYIPYRIPSNIVTEANLNKELKDKINAAVTEQELEQTLREKINKALNEQEIKTIVKAENEQTLKEAKNYIDSKIVIPQDWTETDIAPSALAIEQRFKTK